jgi:adenosylmethionine-8-amino-7-oxononanoate aminotransferase
MTTRDPAIASRDLRAAIVAADKRRIWHPFTPMQRYIDDVDPLVVARAEGSHLYDVDGRRYIDANSSWYVSTLGHGHPRLVAALKEQADRLCHTSLAGVTHEPAAMLAEELVAVAPRGLERVFYSDDGSTAVEVALKLALQFWQNEGHPERRRLVALDGAYHGDTLGAASIGGVEMFRRPFASVMLECVHVPTPADGAGDDEVYRRAFAALEQCLGEGRDTIAALVLEPRVQATNGMRIYSAEYLRRARALCDEHDVLLVIDEVFTGYGRTGPMWACEGAGVAPDLMCVAKGFTGGMLPMGATLTTQRIFDAFLSRTAGADKAFWYGHSYTGNPLGAAVAREVLAVFRDEHILERAAPKAARIAAAFEAMGRMPGVSRSRSLGMIGALDLTANAGYLGDTGWRVHAEARKRGANLRPLGDVVYVTPPLTIADADLEELLAIVEGSVAAALREG